MTFEAQVKKKESDYYSIPISNFKFGNKPFTFDFWTTWRISKKCRWTSNFVPPTQWLPDYDKFYINRFLVRH
jgi:hypothetical protein